MLEIMEPSDLVVRCEYEREGIVVPPEARFMQRGLDFCLDIFDYRAWSVAEITAKCRVTPPEPVRLPGYEVVRLIDSKLTSCFNVDKHTVTEPVTVRHDQAFTLGVVCQGDCRVQAGTENIRLGQGDSFALAAAAPSCRVVPDGGPVTIVTVQPGESMRKD